MEVLRQEMGLAMSLEDIMWCQKYFNEEHREPTITEIKVLDTIGPITAVIRLL